MNTDMSAIYANQHGYAVDLFGHHYFDVDGLPLTVEQLEELLDVSSGRDVHSVTDTRSTVEPC